MESIQVTAVFSFSRKIDQLLETLVSNSSCLLLAGIREEKNNIRQLEDDWTKQLEQLESDPKISRLIISVPSSYTVEQWTERFSTQKQLKRCKLDSIVCLVDEIDLVKAFNLEQTLSSDSDDFHADQLADTLESSDLIVIASAKLGSKTKQILLSIQPNATIMESSELTLAQLVDTQRFQTLQPLDTAGWKQVLAQADWETKKVNTLTQFAFHARRPFHPNRLWELIHQDWPSVYRSAGYFWIASRPDTMYKWSQAGSSSHVEALGYWYAAVDQAEWPVDDLEEMSRVQAIWHPDFGDRAQEIAFIGEKEAEAIKGKLEKALLSEEELVLGKDYWSSYEHDPFPH